MSTQVERAEGRLAIRGGAKVRSAAWPARRLFGQEEKRAAMEVFDKSIASGEAFGYEGEEEQGYCREFAAFMGGGFADGVNSGTTAVWVALRAMELEPGTEVIVPGVTDPGGMMPVALNHCVPVPADVAPGSFCVGAEQIEERITSRTSAILVAHILGYPCEMGAIVALAKRRGLALIEDCAQAHGAKYGGKMVGTLGDIGAFSTMFGKHHATGGQGGVVYVPTQEMYWKVRRYADRGKPFGMAEPTGNVVAGLNCNMDELHAAIGRAQLRKLPGMLRRRRELAEAVGKGCRERLQAVRMLEPVAGGEGSYWCPLFVLALERLRVDKNTFLDALTAEGIAVEKSYGAAPSTFPWFVQRKVFGTSGLPWTSPLYKGDPEQTYDLPNARAADAQLFRVLFHEGCTQQEVADTLEGLAKVEAAFLK